MGVFFQNLVYTLENYSSFKKTILLNNGSILEINDYYITRGNLSFAELFEIKTTLSNHGFAWLDKLNKLENLFCMLGVAWKLN